MQSCFDISFEYFFSGILEVLHCVLVESPEALNIIKEGHIKSIICLLDKHGRNHKVGIERDYIQVNIHEQIKHTSSSLRGWNRLPGALNLNLPESKNHLDKALRHLFLFLGGLVQTQMLDSMILVGLCQLRIIYDSVIFLSVEV